MNTVLFLCTGNYYRSRFAEIFFNWHAEQRGLLWQATSRGLALDPLNPGCMARFTTERLRRHRISSEAYQRMPMDVTVDDLNAASHIIAVKETEHRPLLERRFPQFLDRVEFWHIDDIDCARPNHAMPLLEQQVLQLLDHLALPSCAGQDVR